jgi:hypothetical protein
MNIGEYLGTVADAPATVATVATVEPGGRWVILRTGGSRTLPLAESLADAGYTVWTPRHVQTRRIPRSRAHREQDAALLPTFVFAREEHLSDLMAMASSPSRRHPQFSLFHYMDAIPVITDSALGALRSAEERAILRRKTKKRGRADPYDEGETINMPDGPFVGLSGIVVKSNGKHTLVCLPGWPVEVTINTSQLRTK